jgi:hypothetical protein
VCIAAAAAAVAAATLACAAATLACAAATLAGAYCGCCQLLDVLCFRITQKVVVDESARLPGHHLYPVDVMQTVTTSTYPLANLEVRKDTKAWRTVATLQCATHRTRSQQLLFPS